MGTRFCKLVVCMILGLGALMGMPMRAEEIEELMRTMNEPLIVVTTADESDKDDPLKKLLERKGA
jgi:hypothetical protein